MQCCRDVEPDGRPSARVVLCKKIVPHLIPGVFTNYLSRKGRELTQNPARGSRNALGAAQQVRVEGPVLNAGSR